MLPQDTEKQKQKPQAEMPVKKRQEQIKQPQPVGSTVHWFDIVKPSKNA